MAKPTHSIPAHSVFTARNHISVISRSEQTINDNPYRTNVLTRPEEFFSTDQLAQLATFRKVAQIIVGALIAGCIFFFIVTAIGFVQWDKATASLSSDQLLTMLAIGYAVVCIIASQVIGFFIYKKTPMAEKTPTDPEVAAAHQQSLTELIIRGALLEGGAFFCLIAWLAETSYFSLIGLVVCLFFLVLKMPNEGKHLHDIQRRLTDRD
ncbi:hypothetical protein OAG71_02915 [bacterium]|nr:hypothetical protein [bacterium]